MTKLMSELERELIPRQPSSCQTDANSVPRIPLEHCNGSCGMMDDYRINLRGWTMFPNLRRGGRQDHSKISNVISERALAGLFPPLWINYNGQRFHFEY
jgi:hypothetical protein